MPYTAEINRTNPTCFLFLIDQSQSMGRPFGADAGKSKAQGVADAINRLLQILALKSTKSDGIRDYFYAGVVGYGAEVAPAFTGALAGRTLIPVSMLVQNPLRVDERLRKVEDGIGGLVEQKVKFPVWLEPRAAGKTPMCRALTTASQAVEEFIARFPGCHPPIVINITDGMSSDGPPEAPAEALRRLASQDGNVLLFNAHLSSRAVAAIEFPNRPDDLPDDWARLLFRMSSQLPGKIIAAARNEGLRLADDARGFVFNADLVAIIRFLDIGTRVAGGL